MITYIWFTKKENSILTEQSVRSVLENCNLKKHLIIVSKDPVENENIIKECNKNNIRCEFAISDIGNRQEKIKNMIEWYNKCSDMSEYVCKIDDDTLMFKQNHIDMCINGKKMALACVQKEKMYNSCYVLNSTLIKQIRRESKHFDTETLIDSCDTITKNKISKNGYKDNDFFHTMISLYTDEYSRMFVDFSYEGGFLAGWQYSTEDHQRYYDYFDFVTYGNEKNTNNIKTTMENALNSFKGKSICRK